MLRDLRQAGGGFSSAEDADSPGPDGHGHEGLFHTWTVDEVRAVLGADAGVALEFYGITAGGNFEGRSIPNRLHARGSVRAGRRRSRRRGSGCSRRVSCGRGRDSTTRSSRSGTR